MKRKKKRGLFQFRSLLVAFALSLFRLLSLIRSGSDNT